MRAFFHAILNWQKHVKNDQAIKSVEFWWSKRPLNEKGQNVQQL